MHQVVTSRFGLGLLRRLWKRYKARECLTGNQLKRPTAAVLRGIGVSLVVAAVCASSAPAVAETFYWTGASPQCLWTNGESWSTGYPPNSFDADVVFALPNNAQPTWVCIDQNTHVRSITIVSGGVNLDRCGNRLDISETLTVNSELRLASGVCSNGQGPPGLFADRVQVGPGGVLSLFNQTVTANWVTIRHGGTVQGSGTIAASVVNEGTLFAAIHLPLFGNQPTGRLRIEGDLYCSLGLPASSIKIEVNGKEDSQHGIVEVAGVIGLGGALEVVGSPNGITYEALPGDRLRVIRAVEGGSFEPFGRFETFHAAEAGRRLSSTFFALNHDFENLRLGASGSDHTLVEVLAVSQPVSWSDGPNPRSKLVLITHGSHSSIGGEHDGAFGQMANAMATFASDSGLSEDWLVATLDWSEFANPQICTICYTEYNETARIGAEIAESLVQWLDDQQIVFDQYHLLSHSSGTWFVDRFADTLARLPLPTTPAVNLTLFDAFMPPAIHLGEMGEFATSTAEHYVDRSILLGLPGTNDVLPLAVNIDVTHVSGHPWCCFEELHAWPYQWYLATIPQRDSENNFPPPACDCSNGQIAWGFEQSPMYRQYLDGNGWGSSCPPLDAAAAHLVRLPNCSLIEPANSRVLWPFASSNSSFGPTGSGSFTGDGDAVERTGSPVSMTTIVTSSTPIREISFGFQYQLVAEGVLTVTFDGVEVFQSEQQQEPAGARFSGALWLNEDAPAGTHTLVFTLEPGSGSPAEVRLFGLELGSYVDNCPADFDQDGAVDFFDYDAFVTCFEGGACPAGRTADFDGDGAVDFFDYDAFVRAFEEPC